jgi:ABC-type phosphate/phosphonate transport system substrate-binding protein
MDHLDEEWSVMQATIRTAAMLALLCGLCGHGMADEAGRDSATEAKAQPKTVRIGAVAYSPKAVTIFDGLTRYLNNRDFPSDYVLYSNYDALVRALDRGEVDIAWNTPLAHARYHVGNQCSSQTLVMRDVDFNVRSVLVAREDAGIQSLKDLSGKRLILGSSQAAEATVLPIHFLKQKGVALDKVRIVSLDKEVDSEGNPCASPWHVLQALRDGRGDAGIITQGLWNRVTQQGSANPALTRIWTSPPFSHCVFTASANFDKQRSARFTELMTAMDPSDAATRDVMRLEGTRKWLPGSPDGFEPLVEALRDPLD